MKFIDRRWWAGVLALVLLGIGAVALLIPGSPPTRARQYTARQACLLTGPQGITEAPATTAWAGMEDASLATRAKVIYLSDYGPATAASAIPYANSLIERHCDVVLAVGAPQASALSQLAPRTPKTQFVIIGDGTKAKAANLTTVGLSAETRNQVKQTVESFVGS